MADVTFGVKMPEELKKQIDDLMKDAGLRTGKDFMQSLVNNYVVEKTKESIPEVAQDLKELQTITQRVNDIYLNMGYRIENINKANEKESKDQLTKKDSIISSLQDKNNELNNSLEILEGVFNTTLEDKNKLNDTVNQLTNSINDKNLIVDEYKSKNDMLLGDLSDYKQYKVQLEEYKKLLSDAQARNIDKENIIKDNDYNTNKLNSDLKSKDDVIADLNIRHNAEVSDLSAKHDAALEAFKKDNQKELDQLKKENELNLKLVAAEIKEELNNKFNQEQVKHNLEIAEYQSKYKHLLEELEQSKKVTVKAKEPKVSK